MQRISCATIWGGIQNETVDVCSRSVEASLYSSSAAGGKGGDVYFLSVCGNDLLTRIALADVAGHGQTVSDVSQWLYDCLEARMGSIDGDRILADLNRLAVERGVSALTTGAVASFYTADSNLYFSYAGHHPMLVRRRGESDWQTADLEAPEAGPANLPLGVLADTKYDQRTLRLGSGDRLFLYTDGLIEAPGEDGERFGEKRLRAALDAYAEAELMELKDGVLQAALDFSGGSLTHDDVTLIAVEIR